MLTPRQADAEDLSRAPDPAPPLGSWPRLYGAVIAWQIVLVIALLAFQRAYS